MALILSVWCLFIVLYCFRYVWLWQAWQLTRLAPLLPPSVRSWYRKNLWYQFVRWQCWEAEQGILRRFIQKGDVVVDVGANAGAFTRELSELVGDKGRVYAFEPMPEVFGLLRNTIEKLSLQNVWAYPFGLSNKSEVVDLTLFFLPNSREIEIGASSITGESVHSRKRAGHLRIFVQRFDDFAIENVKFIKIDVERAEYEVLLGMKETIQKYSPVLMVEVWSLDSPVFAMLKEIGYSCFFIHNGELIERYGRECSPSPNYLFLKKT